MRFDISAKTSQSTIPKAGTLPVSITLKPANCCPGTFEYKTTSRALLNMLRDETDLNGYTLASFDGELHARAAARIRGVTLGDTVLREIGYFID